MPAAKIDELAAERSGVVGKVTVEEILLLDWSYLAANWSATPSQIGTTGAGSVYSYTLDGVTRYRLVPATYDSSLDTFYGGWDGSVLSAPLVSRG